jgi:hypothetical protein
MAQVHRHRHQRRAVAPTTEGGSRRTRPPHRVRARAESIVRSIIGRNSPVTVIESRERDPTPRAGREATTNAPTIVRSTRIIGRPIIGSNTALSTALNIAPSTALSTVPSIAPQIGRIIDKIIGPNSGLRGMNALHSTTTTTTRDPHRVASSRGLLGSRASCRTTDIQRTCSHVLQWTSTTLIPSRRSLFWRYIQQYITIKERPTP